MPSHTPRPRCAPRGEAPPENLTVEQATKDYLRHKRPRRPTWKPSKDEPRKPCLRARPERDRLVEANLPLVWAVVRRLTRGDRKLRHVMADDLFQEGCIGLMRAAELFNPLLGVRFSTYAFGWIRQKVGSALRRGGVIALPHTRHAECVRGVVSIHSLWEEDGFVVAAPEQGEAAAAEAEAVHVALSRLSPSHRDVLIARFFSGETLQAIADRVGVRKEAIRLREVRALKLLREELAAADGARRAG